MTVLLIANHPHIDPIALLRVRKPLLDERWRSIRVKYFGRRPPCRIAYILIRAVRRIPVLVDQIPQFLRLKVKDLWRCAVARANGRLIEVEEGRVICGGEVGEVEVDEAVAGFFGRTGKDVIRVVVLDYRGVFDPGDGAAVVFGGYEDMGGGPTEGAGERSGLPGAQVRGGDAAGCREASNGERE